MKTKVQCLYEEILKNMGYGMNLPLKMEVVSLFNQGKRYSGDMIYVNNDDGLDEGLRGYSPSFIVNSLVGGDSGYNVKYPFFTVDNGIQSVSFQEFRRMLEEEDITRFVTRETVGLLDDYDVFSAFASFVYANYPNQEESVNLNAVEDYTADQLFDADWNELAESLMGQRTDDRVLEMTEEELNEIIREGTQKVLEKKGINIDPENRGKFTATKKRTGKSTSELLDSPNKKTRARANFARMAKRGWKPLKKSK